MKKRVAALLAAFLLLFSTGCTPRQTIPEPGFRVVTSFYPIYIMTLNVTAGVDGVRVDNMAGQQAGCLHDYQLQSKDMKNIEKANVFIINGADMESFMDKVTDRLPDLTVVDSSTGIEMLEEDGEPNPHIWVSVTDCMAQVDNIAEGLAKADPDHAAQYRENGQAYRAKLSALREKMHSQLDTLPNKNIVTFHEAFPYFAREFGLNIAGVINREPDSQPSAKELAESIRTVEELGVKALFVEPQYPESAADIVAVESGASVYVLDPGVTGEESLDAYLHAMEANMLVLEKALK